MTESVLSLELALFYLQEADKTLVATEPKMKANLSSDLQIAGKFYKEVCDKLAKICKTSQFYLNLIDKSTGIIYACTSILSISNED